MKSDSVMEDGDEGLLITKTMPTKTPEKHQHGVVDELLQELWHNEYGRTWDTEQEKRYVSRQNETKLPRQTWTQRCQGNMTNSYP